MYGIIRTQPSYTHWREPFEELKKAQEHYNNYYPMMTQYEREILGRELQDKFTQLGQFVIKGAVSEYHQAVNQFEEARKAEIRERRDEITRWSSAKLREEMALTQARLEGLAGTENLGDTLSALLQEAEESGDIHKQRAVAEVIKNSLSKAPEGLENRIEINRIAKNAERRLQELRVTPGMQNASQQAGEAFSAIQFKVKEMEEVEEVLGKSIEFQQAWNRVAIDRDTGKIDILPIDDPRVMGNGETTAQARKRLLG